MRPHEKCIEFSKKHCWCISDFIDELPNEEELKIQKIESDYFNEILNNFHNIGFSKEIVKRELTFWNLFADIRLEYLKKLEELE